MEQQEYFNREVNRNFETAFNALKDIKGTINYLEDYMMIHSPELIPVVDDNTYEKSIAAQKFRRLAGRFAELMENIRDRCLNGELLNMKENIFALEKELRKELKENKFEQKQPKSRGR